MKRLIAAALGIFAAATISITAQAAPMYYTLEGTVSTIEGTSGIAADAGHSTGSAVSYDLLIDTAAQATRTYYDGYTYTYFDSSYFDYFYVDLLSTPIIQSTKEEPAYNAIRDFNLGEYNKGWMNTTMTVSNKYGQGEYTVFKNPALPDGSFLNVADWTVGTLLYADSYASDNLGLYSRIFSHVTITSISDTAPAAASPVPEPGTMLLLGTGMAGVGLVRRLRNGSGGDKRTAPAKEV